MRWESSLPSCLATLPSLGNRNDYKLRRIKIRDHKLKSI